MDTRDGPGEVEGQGPVSRQRANEICAAWGVTPIESDAVSDIELARHLCQELGLDSRTGLRWRGCRCGDLVARLLEYLDQTEQESRVT